MLASWASSEGKCLVHCLLHWISGVQVIALSIRDEPIFSQPAICLLKVSTNLDIVWISCRATLEFVFSECQRMQRRLYSSVGII